MELAAARTRKTPTCHRPSSEVKECTAEFKKRSVCWWSNIRRGADEVSCEYECRYQCCTQLPTKGTTGTAGTAATATTANTTPISSAMQSADLISEHPANMFSTYSVHPTLSGLYSTQTTHLLWPLSESGSYRPLAESAGTNAN